MWLGGGTLFSMRLTGALVTVLAVWLISLGKRVYQFGFTSGIDLFLPSLILPTKPTLWGLIWCCPFRYCHPIDDCAQISMRTRKTMCLNFYLWNNAKRLHLFFLLQRTNNGTRKRVQKAIEVGTNNFVFAFALLVDIFFFVFFFASSLCGIFKIDEEYYN